jgi:hypothetical protein
MDEKSDLLDLSKFVVECEAVPPSERTLAAIARRGRRKAPTFVKAPTDEKSIGVSGTAYKALCCLLDLKLRQYDKGEPVIFSNWAAARWKLSRWQKLRALKELARHGILTYTATGRENPRVTLLVTE